MTFEWYYLAAAASIGWAMGMHTTAKMYKKDWKQVTQMAKNAVRLIYSKNPFITMVIQAIDGHLWVSRNVPNGREQEVVERFFEAQANDWLKSFYYRIPMILGDKLDSKMQVEKDMTYVEFICLDKDPKEAS